MSDFHALNLPTTLLSALDAVGFTTATEIQKLSIPHSITGRDVMACAQTGSGKTAAFVIPIVAGILKSRENKVAPQDEDRALILAPTRELAEQIEKVVKDLSRTSPGIKTVVLIGGTSMGPQFQALKRNPHVIIATPGRLMDHLNRGSVNLSKIKRVVLDECDRMLDMGFAPQIAEILSDTPKNRQTLLFSATFPDNIKKLALSHMTNPVRVGATQTNAGIPLKLIQAVIETTPEEKSDALVRELKTREGSVIIFTRTKIRTDRLGRYLHKSGFAVRVIHGDRTQGQRKAALDDFRSGMVKILVATDVAARGIDVPHIAHVVNFDLPQAAEDYLHRIGRTARAGAEGKAVSFVTPEEKGLWRDIDILVRRANGENIPQGRSGGGGGGRGPRRGGSGGGGHRKGQGSGKRFGGNGGAGRGREARPGTRPEFKSEARPEFRPENRSDAQSPRGDFAPRSASRPQNGGVFANRAPRSNDGRPQRSSFSRPERTSEGRQFQRNDGARPAAAQSHRPHSGPRAQRPLGTAQ